MGTTAGKSVPVQFTRGQQAELAKKSMTVAIWNRALDAAKWPLIVVAAWVPLEGMHAIIHDLAGKTTVLDANLVVTISFSASVVSGVGWAQSAARSRARKKELERARSRETGLEAKLLREEE